MLVFLRGSNRRQVWGWISDKFGLQYFCVICIIFPIYFLMWLFYTIACVVGFQSVAEGQLCMEIVLLIEAAFYCLPFHGLVALHWTIIKISYMHVLVFSISTEEVGETCFRSSPHPVQILSNWQATTTIMSAADGFESALQYLKKKKTLSSTVRFDPTMSLKKIQSSLIVYPVQFDTYSSLSGDNYVGDGYNASR